MTDENARRLVEEALQRIPHVEHLRVGAVVPFSSDRWAVRIEHKDGKLRTNISFGYEAGGEPESGELEFRSRAQVELQKYLKLCPLCQRESYVHRVDPMAVSLFVSCPSCGEYEISGADIDELRIGVAVENREIVEALPRLVEFVHTGSGTVRIDGWRAIARKE